jgi:DNA-binding response OmpR family regulator
MIPPKLRLLLAEDHQDTSDLLTLVLASENYDVAISTSVARALEMTNHQKFDVIVIDSHLRDGSGIDLCRAIRRHGVATPILFYSGMAYEKDKQQAFSAGAQEFLVKPVGISLLVEKLRMLIADAKTHPAPITQTSKVRQDSGDLRPGERA